MKKIILLAAVVTVASFTSCKKEKTCSCTETVSNSNSSYPVSTSSKTIEYKYGKMKKGQATQVCPTSTTEAVNNGVSGAGANVQTTTTSCSIK